MIQETTQWQAALFFIIALAALGEQSGGQSQMLHLQGAAQHVAVPSSADLMPLAGLTVEAWVRYDPSATSGTAYPTIIRKDPSTHPYILRLIHGSNRIEFMVWTSNLTILNPTINLSTQTWHHIAGTWDGSTMRVFLNGVQLASMPKTGTMLQTSGPLLIGRGNSDSENWGGQLDEVRIWSVARTPAEISSSMGVQIDGHPDLISAWHFNGGLEDFSGGHDGVKMGGATLATSTSPVDPLQLVAPSRSGIGSPLKFQISGTSPNSVYFLDCSVAGTSTGVPLPAPLTGVFPIDPPLLNTAIGALAPGVFVGFGGVTDGNGNAVATFAVPPLNSLVGLTVNAAFLYLDSVTPVTLGGISAPTATVLTTPTPTVTSVSPTSGPHTGGWPVVITGTGFGPGSIVKFGHAGATSITVVNSTTITCLSPPSTGLVDISVTDPASGTGTLAASYSYVAPIIVSSVSPELASAGTVITISGQGFQTGLTVVAGGIPAVVLSVTASTITFVSPANSACDSSVVVINPDGQVGYRLFNPSPLITTTVNASGPAAGGAPFFILGTNLAFASVTVGGSPAALLTATDNILQVVAPPGTVGGASVDLTGLNGCTATSTYLYQ
ncbi:MAG: IPT/TIG domain-containing protein [Planctomycetes bacterium]|nr:IPT/TIG domain-containing protein [Planctomycetota bacterium]